MTQSGYTGRYHAVIGDGWKGEQQRWRLWLRALLELEERLGLEDGALFGQSVECVNV